MFLAFEIAQVWPLKNVVRTLEKFLPKVFLSLEVFPFIQDIFLIISGYKYPYLVIIYKHISYEYCVFAIPYVELDFLAWIAAVSNCDCLVL